MFETLDNRRDIRKPVVNKLYNLLTEGLHFETPIMTNIRKDKHRLLDGNHRIEAIKRYLSDYPNRKVEVWEFAYNDLSDQDEKEMYTKWNLGQKQTTNDFVKQYWDDIPLTRYINSFPYPVTHSWTSNSIEFKLLVSGYLTKLENKFSGGFFGKAVEFINLAIKLDKSDADKMRAFLTDYISVFGYPDKKNMHYEAAFFHSMIRIWLDNLQSKNQESIRSAFKKLRGSAIAANCIQGGGTSRNCMTTHELILQALNASRKQNLWV
jgi:hypothetical protein